MELITNTWSFLFQAFQSINTNFIQTTGIIGSWIVFMIIFRKLVRLFRKLI